MPPVIQIAIDCHDADRLISFWTAALGYVTEPPPDGWDSWLAYWQAAGIPDEDLQGAEKGSGAIIDPTGSGPRVFFQEVPEPKVVKNRVHLDISSRAGCVCRSKSAARKSTGRWSGSSGSVPLSPTGTHPRGRTSTRLPCTTRRATSSAWSEERHRRSPHVGKGTLPRQVTNSAILIGRSCGRRPCEALVGALTQCCTR